MTRKREAKGLAEKTKKCQLRGKSERICLDGAWRRQCADMLIYVFGRLQAQHIRSEPSNALMTNIKLSCASATRSFIR
jgi:hypothetical protein